MRIDLLIPTMIVAVSLFGGTNVTAEGKKPNPSAGRGHVLAPRMLDGSIEPEKISFGTRYRMLIGRYQAHIALVDQLSRADREVVEQLVKSTPAEDATINEAYMQARLNLCANRAGKTPLEIAQEWDQILDEYRTLKEARYRKALDALSVAGRNAVEYYVETEVVPGIKTLRSPSSVEHAKADPDDFMEAVDIDCYVAEHGRLPADAQEAFDEALKRFEEERRTQS